MSGLTLSNNVGWLCWPGPKSISEIGTNCNYFIHFQNYFEKSIYLMREAGERESSLAIHPTNQANLLHPVTPSSVSLYFTLLLLQCTSIPSILMPWTQPNHQLNTDLQFFLLNPKSNNNRNKPRDVRINSILCHYRQSKGTLTKKRKVISSCLSIQY